MPSERIEVRLDPEHRRRLTQLAQAEGATVSETIRRIIDERFEQRLREQQLAAMERLVSREIEDVPDPEELSRQLAEAHNPGPLPN